MTEKEAFGSHDCRVSCGYRGLSLPFLSPPEKSTGLLGLLETRIQLCQWITLDIEIRPRISNCAETAGRPDDFMGGRRLAATSGNFLAGAQETAGNKGR